MAEEWRQQWLSGQTVKNNLFFRECACPRWLRKIDDCRLSESRHKNWVDARKKYLRRFNC